MVSKKAQPTEAKKADVKNEAKAKVVAEKKKAATKTVASKPVAKKTATKKVVEPKASEAKEAPKVVVKTAENPILEKENVDTLATVLAVKAENENKKAAKALKKEAKASAKKSAKKEEKVEVKTETKSEKVEELGKKATPARDKREVVKENVQKAQTKKFVEEKKEAVRCCCKGKDLFASWVRAYKNMFKYNARTSRYEAWAFMLINSIFASLLFFTTIYSLTNALIERNFTTGKTFFSVFILLFSVAQIFVYISLAVRRLHDAGFSAWKGFFRPLTLSAIAVSLLSIPAVKYIDLSGDLTAENYLSTHVINLVLSVSLLISILVWTYYSLKTLIVSFFYEENRNDSTYGIAMYCDDCYKAMGIRYMVLYFIYSSISYSLLNMYIVALTNLLSM